MPSEPLSTVCPHCRARLRVDPMSGEVLAHDPPPEDLEEAGRRATEGAQRARQDAFDAALRAERSRETELDDLFRKASEKQADKQDDEERPDNPLDDRWR